VSMTKEQYVAEHFPDVSPGATPCGPKIIVQLRTIKTKTSGGIVLVEETKDFNNGNTQIARVVSIGQIAFRDRSSGETWKEGAWCGVGDIIMIPRWGGLRFEIPIPGRDENAIFATIDDTNVQMVLTGNFAAFDTLL